MTINSVRDAGVLRAAVSLGIPGLSAMDVYGRFQGMDADFARALAAAVLGDGDAVEWVRVSPGERIDAVRSGKVDIGTCNTSWTLSREAEVLFAGVLVHDGEGFLVHEDLGVTAISELGGRKLAIQAGTTSADNIERWRAAGGPDVVLAEYDTPRATLAAYVNRECDGYVLDRTALAGIRAELPDPSAHRLLDETISDEPMAPFVATEAADLFVAARWTLHLLLAAEAAARTATPLPLTDIDELGPRLGLPVGWATAALKDGHYGDIYARNLGDRSPLGLPRGRNELWISGGLHYAPPLR
jgi:general L-amino acid transport system substrate-binding protein